MQYDLNKLDLEAKLKLRWHGEDTRVLIKGDVSKTDVKTGAVIEVVVSQAKELLSYSKDWTLEGDKPKIDGYDQVIKNSRVAKAPEGSEENPIEITKMDKKSLIKALKKEKISFNDKATEEELRGLLVEHLNGNSEEVSPEELG